LNTTQQIQDAIVRIRVQNSSTPLDIAAQMAPTSLEGTMPDLHDPSEQDDNYLRSNASMLAAAYSEHSTSSSASEPKQSHRRKSLTGTSIP